MSTWRKMLCLSVIFCNTKKNNGQVHDPTIRRDHVPSHKQRGQNACEESRQVMPQWRRGRELQGKEAALVLVLSSQVHLSTHTTHSKGFNGPRGVTQKLPSQHGRTR
jgi:hypothetical protein